MSGTVSQSRINAALAVLRIALGIVFVAHGVQKLFIFGLAGTAGFFGSAGLPPFLGPVVGFGELLGGVALVAGFLTPVAATGLSLIMLGAIVKIHLPGGFFMPKGVEFAFALLAGLVALILTGAGNYSLDAAIARKRAR